MPRMIRAVRFAGAALMACIAVLIAVTPEASAQAKKPATSRGAPAAAATPAIKPLIETLTGEARTEYQAGTVLFGDGDFATALQKFKTAQAKQNDPRLLYNMASAEKSLRHYATSAKLLRRYLAEGGVLITPEDRRDAEDLVKVIDALTLPVTINVSESGAQVFLDDELLGVSPLVSDAVVDVGQRKLRAQKDGFRTLVTPVQIGPAHSFDMTLEPMRGRLELKTKSGATVYLDDKPIGQGPLVVSDDLAVGGHALRITAPRMRPYQGEIVLQDGRTRSLDIELETDLEQLSEVRVAVGCADPHIRTPDDGLSIFFDDAQVSASPLGVRKRVEDNHEVPAYVPFTVPAGQHLVRVRFPGCGPLQTSADAAAGGAVDITGMLPPENPWFNGTPAGSPNGFRVSLGVTFSSIGFNQFQNLFNNAVASQARKVDVSLVGPSASVGTQTRWFMGVIDVRYVTGSTSGSGITSDTMATVPAGTSAPFNATVSVADVGLRIGPRLPLNIASISGGALAGAGVLRLEPSGALTRTSGTVLGGFGRGGFWAAVQAQPLCDFSLGLGFSLSAVASGNSVDPTAEAAWTIHVGYEPNVLCRRQRAGLYRIKADGSAHGGTVVPEPRVNTGPDVTPAPSVSGHGT